MKNKIIFTIFTILLGVPTLLNAYNPTDAELRSSLFNYITNQSQRQQYQDIIDRSNRENKNSFDTYYRNTEAILDEYEFKIKELELKQSTDARNKTLQKEIELMNKELELIRKESELKKLENNIGKPVSPKLNLDEAINETLKEIEESRKIEVSKNKQQIKTDTSAGIFDNLVPPSQRNKQKGVFDDYSEVDKTTLNKESIIPEPNSKIVTPEQTKSQTRFDSFKNTSINTFKKVSSWINPFSWFKSE